MDLVALLRQVEFATTDEARDLALATLKRHLADLDEKQINDKVLAHYMPQIIDIHRTVHEDTELLKIYQRKMKNST